MEDQDCQSGSQSCAQTPSQTPSHSPAYNDEDLEMQQIELEERLNLCNKKEYQEGIYP